MPITVQTVAVARFLQLHLFFGLIVVPDEKLRIGLKMLYGGSSKQTHRLCTLQYMVFHLTELKH
jgi:hypothetical protein